MRVRADQRRDRAASAAAGHGSRSEIAAAALDASTKLPTMAIEMAPSPLTTRSGAPGRGSALVGVRLGLGWG